MTKLLPIAAVLWTGKAQPTYKITQPTQSSVDSKVDELLIAWHQWGRSYKIGRGYAGTDSTCRDFRTPAHWDWRNGALDGRVDKIQAQAVGEAIDRIPNTPRRWQTALSFEARNLSSGAAVWSSPVLPRDPEERKVLVLEARNKLFVELRRGGFFE